MGRTAQLGFLASVIGENFACCIALLRPVASLHCVKRPFLSRSQMVGVNLYMNGICVAGEKVTGVGPLQQFGFETGKTSIACEHLFGYVR